MVFSRRGSQALWVIENFLRYGFSFWFAYFGASDDWDSFCGTPIEEVFSIGPCWPPMGLTLLANRFRGRLNLLATFVPGAVSEATAGRFLDAVVGDLG
jgi:hypothetical protein